MRLLILTEKIAPPAYTPRIQTLVRYLRSQGHECDWVDDGNVSPLDIASYDWIVCSTYYYYPLSLAGHLSRQYHKPLLVDLRDIAEQWGKEGFHTRHLPWKWLDRPVQDIVQRIRIIRRNRVIRQATTVTTVSPWHRDFLSRINPNTHLIYNGFDAEELQPRHTVTDVFRITYMGQIHDLRLRNPERLFQVVSSLNKLDISLDFYTGDRNKEELLSLALHYNLPLHIHPFVPRSELSSIMHQSGIMLFLTTRSTPEGTHGIMGTKFYEALGVEKPLLCIPNDNDCLEKAINDTHAGLASDDTEEIRAFILDKYNEWKTKGYTHQAVINKEPFTRQYQAKQFENLLCQK